MLQFLIYRKMSSLSAILSGIDFKIKQLVEKLKRTERELAEAKQANQELLDIIETQKEQIKTLEEQNKILILRNTLDNTKGDSAKVKLKINKLIRDIDKSIELLTKMEHDG